MQLLMSQRTWSTSRRVVTILQYHVIIMYTAGFFSNFVLINYVLSFNHLFQIIIHNYIFTLFCEEEGKVRSEFIHPSIRLSLLPSVFISIYCLSASVAPFLIYHDAIIFDLRSKFKEESILDHGFWQRLKI